MVKEPTIKEAIQFKEAELDVHKKAINEIERELAVLKKVSKISVLSGTIPQKEDNENISDNSILAVKITNVLKEADEFLLAKELLVRFNMKYPKNYDIIAFASMLSKNHKRPDNDICLLEVKGVQKEIKYNYGLKQWLIDENTPKEEYIQKLKQRGIWQ